MKHRVYARHDQFSTKSAHFDIAGRIVPRYQPLKAPIAQLDRALPSEGRGRRFESCWVHHFPFLTKNAKTRKSGVLSRLFINVSGGHWGSGGETGIRTLETVSRLHTFQACAFDHSATSPCGRFSVKVRASARAFCNKPSQESEALGLVSHVDACHALWCGKNGSGWGMKSKGCAVGRVSENEGKQACKPRSQVPEAGKRAHLYSKEMI